MNANELMLGDLITFKDCQGDKCPTTVKIWQINADGDAFVSIDGSDVLDEIIIDDEVVGIPLTPEILEKNGFDFGYTASEEDFCSAVGCGYPEEKGWCFDEGAGEIKIIFPNDTDGGLIRLDDQCADRHFEFFLSRRYMFTNSSTPCAFVELKRKSNCENTKTCFEKEMVRYDCLRGKEGRIS